MLSFSAGRRRWPCRILQRRRRFCQPRELPRFAGMFGWRAERRRAPDVRRRRPERRRRRRV